MDQVELLEKIQALTDRVTSLERDMKNVKSATLAKAEGTYEVLRDELISMLATAHRDFGSGFEYRKLSARFGRAANRIGGFSRFMQKLEGEGIVSAILTANGAKIVFLRAHWEAMPEDAKAMAKLPQSERRKLQSQVADASARQGPSSNYERFEAERDRLKHKYMADGMNEIDALERASEEAEPLLAGN
jgi:hypothetical protein